MTIRDEVFATLQTLTGTSAAHPVVAADLERGLHAAVPHPEVSRHRISELLTALLAAAGQPGQPARIALVTHLALDGPTAPTAPTARRSC